MVPAEEWLVVAVLLSTTGGYLDAFTWMMHGVMATTQSANVVLLGVRAATGEWARASKHIPPIFACVVGVFVAYHIRLYAPDKGRRLSLVIEIIVLLLALRLHMHVPEMAGTIGISFAAAVQNTCFTRVEGWPYSSIMTTRNLQQMAEGLISALAGFGKPAGFRQAIVFGSICLAFALGAVMGAVATTNFGNGALTVPIGLVLTTLVLCEVRRGSDS